MMADPPPFSQSLVMAWKRDAERRRRALRAFMADRGLKSAEWARRAGVNSAAIYNFLNGHSHSLSPLTYKKLAEAEGVPTEVLSGETATVRVTSPVTIVGRVQAGIWQEAVEWPDDEKQVMAIPVPTKYRSACYGLKIDGPSMNECYPDGSVVVCINIHDFKRDLLPGDHVVCHRIRKDGLIEATVKELFVDEKNEVWLMPRSSDPRYKQPVSLVAGGDVERVEIIAVAIGSYTARPNT